MSQPEKNNQFDVTIEEAFEMGRIEGLKEAFNEMSELSATDFVFFKTYIKARLKSLHNNILSFAKFRRGIQ